MKALGKLLFKYIFGGEGLFFIFIFPVLLLGIMGEIFISSSQPGMVHDTARTFINGISVSSIISFGIMMISTIVTDFKTSVIMKRIGATKVSNLTFVGIILCIFLFTSFFSFFYVRLIGTLLYGWRDGINWNVGFYSGMWNGIPWVMLAAAISVLLGLLISSLCKNIKQVQMIGNLIYFPISILSGGFAPITSIKNSSFLNGLSYINPFKYSLDPYYDKIGTQGLDISTGEIFIYLAASLAIISLLIILIKKNLKWTT